MKINKYTYFSLRLCAKVFIMLYSMLDVSCEF